MTGPSELEQAQAQLAANPPSADNFNRVAIAYLKQSDLTQAVNYIAGAIALEPGEALHYNNRGRILFALERFPEALADYTKAIELAPASAQLYAARSVVNMALGKEAAALGDLNDAFDLDPSLENLLNRVAFFANKGLAADALRDMNSVIERQPGDPNHYMTRANLAFALARHQPELYDLGISDIEEALKQDQTGVLQPTLLQLADQLEKLPAR